MEVDTRATPSTKKRAVGPHLPLSTSNPTEDPRFGLILGAVARGWCYKVNASKRMDPDLAACIALEVYQMTGEQSQDIAGAPWWLVGHGRFYGPFAMPADAWARYFGREATPGEVDVARADGWQVTRGYMGG